MTDASSSAASQPQGSSSQGSSPPQNPNHTSLPPLTTSTPSRRSNMPRPISHASKSRLSQYSVGSIPSRSRPGSHMFPFFPSSLSYTIVRDFAYPHTHPLHYGPPPEPSGPPSGLTTPASETRRLSDPPASWDQRMPWDSWTSDGFNRGHDIPPIQMGDGPPYSEDEDLQSPVVATRHRKHKSTSAALGQGRGRAGREGDIMTLSNYDSERGYYVGTSGDGSERYYVAHGGEANEPGGEYVTYPPNQARQSRGYHYSQQPQNERYGEDDSSSPSSPGYQDADESRYSRDYQFTITSPDEEFHGKAVALFDFERENENELPLVEGQIIWVSYRHGQGWLVAEDPKTQESGLVPEEYVRLLRDIEGGMNSLTGNIGDGGVSPNEADTPTQAEHIGKERQSSITSINGYHQPVVSVFSTSSKDLNPYPTEQLGIQAGQTPPQVVHYHGQRGGSQTNTPTIAQHSEPGILRRGSQGSANDSEAGNTPVQEHTNTEAAQAAAR
ncbi:HOG (high osmolarity glycerol) pathway protein [Conoideocrella luteorostrata]|uniref:HOG (High osmolarity glycerol) pathway protein n=1 Tax=Conoideocrella luteorostrata TaxID=1105319 RepID=A0AAJ0CAL2_9HYPO|nr:HOG (high osmolarity glycerol) pathway protein [Conoideocrella luteorostrata]